MSGRVVYDSNDEIKLLVGFAQSCKKIAGCYGITEFDQHEIDFIHSCFKAGRNPADAVLTVKRWRDSSV